MLGDWNLQSSILERNHTQKELEESPCIFE